MAFNRDKILTSFDFWHENIASKNVPSTLSIRILCSCNTIYVCTIHMWMFLLRGDYSDSNIESVNWEHIYGRRIWIYFISNDFLSDLNYALHVNGVNDKKQNVMCDLKVKTGTSCVLTFKFKFEYIYHSHNKQHTGMQTMYNFDIKYVFIVSVKVHKRTHTHTYVTCVI